MKKIFFAFLLGFSLTVKAQIIDHYGVKSGLGFSNQKLTYDDRYIVSNTDEWRNKKLSYHFQLFAEKEFNHSISLRLALGYQNKGFKENYTAFYTPPSNNTPPNNGLNTVSPPERLILIPEGNNTTNGKAAEYSNTNHNISTDLILLVRLKSTPKPYLQLGFRHNLFLSSNQELNITEGPTLDHEIFNYNYNKSSFSAILGLGYKINNLFFVEAEYIPSLTKILERSSIFSPISTEHIGLDISDRIFSIGLGFYIDSLFNK